MARNNCPSRQCSSLNLCSYLKGKQTALFVCLTVAGSVCPFRLPSLLSVLIFVEFGRLPQDVSSWVAKLLDLGTFTLYNIRGRLHVSPGIVELRGKMTDCPERLSTGASPHRHH